MSIRNLIVWLLGLFGIASFLFGTAGCILTAENAGGYTITFGTTLDIASRSSTTDSKSTVKIDVAPTAEFVDALTPNAVANEPMALPEEGDSDVSESPAPGQ